MTFGFVCYILLIFLMNNKMNEISFRSTARFWHFHRYDECPIQLKYDAFLSHRLLSLYDFQPSFEKVFRITIVI